MRELEVAAVTETVARLCIESNVVLPDDVRAAIEAARQTEEYAPAVETLALLQRNEALAREQGKPVCQDTGLACVFLEIGQEVHLVGGDLRAAVDAGVRDGYRAGLLRNSVVGDPLRRVNTGDNTPAALYTEIVPGDRVIITVAPKGFGSENMSAIRMLRPADGAAGVVAFVLETVRSAGGNPCPPVVVGVGIGGTFDGCALLAKKALLRPLDAQNGDPYYAELERTLLVQINELGIGPQGFGGRTTALGVAVETAPTHIAGLPCAVNISCHVTRHCTEVL